MNIALTHLVRTACILLALAGAGHTLATETVLLGEQFTDNERATQTLPGSGKWLYAGGPTAANRLWVTPPAGSGEMRMLASGGNGAAAMALAYFTTSGAPRTLAAGESITLDFTAKLDALKNASLNFRVALFNSLGSRPTADSEGGVSNASLYANTHSGYIVGLNTGATTASYNLFERNNQGNSTPFSVGTQMGSDNQASLNLKVKQPFPVKLKISRSTGAGSSVTIEATINGLLVSRTDSSGILTSFDGCGFFISSDALGAEQAVTVDALTVKHADALGAVTTLLDDTFTDNDRTNQILPASAEWFYAGQSVAAVRLSAAAAVSSQNLVFTPGGVDAMTLAYFTPAGSPQSLAVGESITFQAGVHLDVLANAADGIRFGLFNSGAVRATADSEAGIDSPATYNSYLGYSVWLNPGAAGGFNLYRRGATGPHPFSAAANTRMGADNIADLALTTSVEMIPRFSMTITRLSTGIQIEAAINGRNVVRTETTAVTTSFDTIGFFSSGAALYEGPQAVFDTVNVIHSGVVPAVPSTGKIFSQTFDGSAWPTSVFVGTQATGAVSGGALGTINVLGGVTPSGGIKLDVNSTGLTGYWAGALNSGMIAITNTETDLGKLTLAFDLSSSAVRPVRVRVESADAGGTVSGAREKLIYPAVPGSFQRYAIDLADMTAAGGTFSPTSPNVKVTYQIEGGVDAGSWPAGTHSLQVDNIYYAKPAYYVKPGGAGSQNGITEANAFANISSALTVANVGDIVSIMAAKPTSAIDYDPLAVDYNLSAALGFSRGGAAPGWVTLKNYHGHRPLIKRLSPTTGSYDIIYLTKGANGAVDYTSNLNYIEIRGLRVTGTADTLPVADRGGSTARSNNNGISASGRYMIKPPHHLRFADNEVFNVSAGGIGSIDSDYVTIENNEIHDTSNWTIYATSGMGQLTPSSFDGTAGTYRTFWLGNKSYRNETKIPWVAIGAISDGNGAIVDTFLTTRHGPFLGRVIVANNLFYENGGSGVHTLKVNGADIINNTVVRNSHSPALTYSNLFTSESNDIVIANNIVVASPGETINGASYSIAFPQTTGVAFRNNIYQSDGSTNTPYTGPGDSGNIVTTDVKFVDEAVGTNDYRLRNGSPAFNAALASSVLPIRDSFGILRRIDGLPDIGACERQPAIVVPPVSQTVAAGGSVTLSVVAQSAGPNSGLTYQWQRNGINVAGATNSTLALSGTSLATAGDYRALVSVGSPAFDTVTSPIGTLTLQTPYATTTYLTSSANPASFGTSITLTATVSSAAGTPAGTVTFLDGVVTLGTAALNSSGVATLTMSNLTSGSHSITATYGAASNYSASTSSAVTQVIQPIATATALASSTNPASFGASITFTATVTSSSGTPTGTVTFKDGAVTLGAGTISGGGAAVLTTSALASGSHPLTASFAASGNFAGSVSAVLNQAIRYATTTALASSANPAVVGTPVTFTATVSSSLAGATGIVTFSEGAASIGSAALNGSGVAAITTSALTVGSHPIIASYPGDGTHDPSISSQFVETAVTPYDAWRAAFFSPADLADEARAGPNADPDGDGFQNLIEYAFNTDPLLAGNAGLPVTGRDASGNLYISFNRLREDLTYIVEVGGDLAAWTTLAANPGTLGQNVLVTDNVLSETTVRFLRLHVIH